MITGELRRSSGGEQAWEERRRQAYLGGVEAAAAGERGGRSGDNGRV